MPRLILTSAFIALSLGLTSNASATSIGFCVTPVGTFGVIPCDMGCSGAAIAEKSADTISQYADYIQEHISIAVNAQQCSVNDQAGWSKYRSEISSSNRDIQTEIEDYTLVLSDKLGALAIIFDGSIKSMSSAFKSLITDTVNIITMQTKSAVRATVQSGDLSRSINSPVIRTIAEDLKHQRSLLIKDLEANKLNLSFRTELEVAEQTNEHGKSTAVKQVHSEFVKQQANFVWSENNNFAKPSVHYRPLLGLDVNEVELSALVVAAINRSNIELLRSDQ